MKAGVLFQYFEWNCKPDGTLWEDLCQRAKELKSLGITAVWLPPACKGSDAEHDSGYAVYDIWDLGEFDQKGGIRTKYGTKEQFLEAIAALHAQGIQAYADVVLNHKMGGDELEEVEVREVNPANANEPRSEPYTIKTWSKFNFAGRNKKYSPFTYNRKHFTAFGGKEGEDPEKKGAVYRVSGKSFSDEPEFAGKNNDFLLGADLDLYDDEVRADLFAWGRWFIETTGVDGFRLDAVKHMAASFYRDWLGALRQQGQGKELFAVGEYSTGNIEELKGYLDASDGDMNLLDIPLQTKLHAISNDAATSDLSKIFENSLVALDPVRAVTFVETHDTQLGKSEAYVQDWFKPQAYALILLREAGYPCVFYGDYFGSAHAEKPLTSFKDLLAILLGLRSTHMHGVRQDYFDDARCVGWTWSGNRDNPGSLVVILSTGNVCRKRMRVPAGSREYFDATQNLTDTIVTDENGEAEFHCLPGGLSVWRTT